MNYNRFYKKRDRTKRSFSTEEKQNLWKISRGLVFGFCCGVVAGVLLVILYTLVK